MKFADEIAATYTDWPMADSRVNLVECHGCFEVQLCRHFEFKTFFHGQPAGEVRPLPWCRKCWKRIGGKE
jgi:hypothetical protein